MSSHFQVESWLNFYQVKSLYSQQVYFQTISSHFRVKSVELTLVFPNVSHHHLYLHFSRQAKLEKAEVRPKTIRSIIAIHKRYNWPPSRSCKIIGNFVQRPFCCSHRSQPHFECFSRDAKLHSTSDNLFLFFFQIEKRISENYALHISAQDAYKHFIRSYASHPQKSIFDVNKLDLVKVALSFGFKVPPFVDLSSLNSILAIVAWFWRKHWSIFILRLTECFLEGEDEKFVCLRCLEVGPGVRWCSYGEVGVSIWALIEGDGLITRAMWGRPTYSDDHPSWQSSLCQSPERLRSSMLGNKWTCGSFAAVLKWLLTWESWTLTH